MMERKSWFSRKPQGGVSDFAKEVKSTLTRETLGSMIRSGGVRDAMIGDVETKYVAGGADLIVTMFIPENTPDPKINLNWLPTNHTTPLLRLLKPVFIKAASRMGAIAADIEVKFSDFETGDAYSTYLLTVSFLQMKADPEPRATLGTLKNR